MRWQIECIDRFLSIYEPNCFVFLAIFYPSRVFSSFHRLLAALKSLDDVVERSIEASLSIHVLAVFPLRDEVHISDVVSLHLLVFRRVESGEAHDLHHLDLLVGLALEVFLSERRSASARAAGPRDHHARLHLLLPLLSLLVPVLVDDCPVRAGAALVARRSPRPSRPLSRATPGAVAAAAPPSLSGPRASSAAMARRR